MSDTRKPTQREPYVSPSLQPQRLFVDAVTPGCCRASLQTCSEPMRASGGTGGKTQRGRSGT